MPSTKTTAAIEPRWLTGQRLFGLLAIGLLMASIAYDTGANHWQQPLKTLTLPWLVSFAIVVGLGMAVVPLLRRLKTGQIIREDGPQSHLQKSGTPTMGESFLCRRG